MVAEKEGSALADSVVSEKSMVVEEIEVFSDIKSLSNVSMNKKSNISASIGSAI
jgi:hypothetical protein